MGWFSKKVKYQYVDQRVEEVFNEIMQHSSLISKWSDYEAQHYIDCKHLTEEQQILLTEKVNQETIRCNKIINERNQQHNQQHSHEDHSLEELILGIVALGLFYSIIQGIHK